MDRFQYSCMVCNGKTGLKEKCVWCGSRFFVIERWTEIKRPEIKGKIKKGRIGSRHFGKDYDGFCLEM